MEFKGPQCIPATGDIELIERPIAPGRAVKSQKKESQLGLLIKAFKEGFRHRCFALSALRL